MNVNSGDLLRNSIDKNQEESKHLQVDDNNAFMTSHQKMTMKKIFKTSRRVN